MQSLKKKHSDGVSEMVEQVDQLNKMKAKVEKEKHAKRLQIDELKAAQDRVANEKASLEKQNRLLEQQRFEISRKAEEAHMTLTDFDNAKKKVTIENADLLHSIEELESNNAVLGRFVALSVAGFFTSLLFSISNTQTRTNGTSRNNRNNNNNGNNRHNNNST